MKKLIIKLLILVVICTSLIGCQKNDEIIEESTENEAEEAFFQNNIIDRYSKKERQTLETFLKGYSAVAFIQDITDIEIDSTEVTDYQKLMVYYFMMFVDGKGSMDAFEDAGLLKESMDANEYILTTEQFETAIQYIWKTGLNAEDAVHSFMTSNGMENYGDNTYGMLGIIGETGRSQVDKVVVFETEKDTLQIIAKTQFGISDEDEVFYIRAEAEKNEESPLAGMTITKIMISNGPDEKITGISGEDVKSSTWIRKYKDFLSDGENFVSAILYEEHSDGATEGCLDGFALHDMNDDTIPELLISRNGVNTVFVYTYDPFGEVVMPVGSYQVDEYDRSKDRNSIGFDKETNVVLEYTEGAMDDELCISLASLTMDKYTMQYESVDISSIYTEGAENNYESNINYWNNNRQQIWKDALQSEETAAIYNNYVPFVWHEINQKEIENYINTDYKKNNSNVSSPEDNLFIKKKKIDAVEILKERTGEEIIYYGDFYVDLVGHCSFYVDELKERGYSVFSPVCQYDIVIDSSSGYVNFRFGPDIEFGIIGRINNGEELRVIKESAGKDKDLVGDEWVGVEYNGIFGWISSSQVVDVASLNMSDEEKAKKEHLDLLKEQGYNVGSSMYDYPIITDSSSGYVDFRVAPNMSSGIMDRIPNGKELYVTMESLDDEWLGVVYNGTYGWVANSQIAYVTSEGNVKLEQQEFTEEELQMIRDSLGVPADMKAEIGVGKSYYWPTGECVLTPIHIATENGHASAHVLNNGELGTTILPYTEE